MRLREEKETATFEGYEIIDYLYNSGARTIEEIENNTGLSQSQIMERIQAFINQRFIEKLAIHRFHQ